MGIQERIDSLAPRERQLLGVLGVVFLLMVLLFIPIGISVMLGARRDENEQLRAAIDRIYSEREVVERHKQEKEALLSKYRTPPPPLAGYLSKLASSNSLEVPEIKDRPPVPHGKKYEEQSVEVSLKKVGMLNLAKFLEAIGQGSFPVSISKLNIHKRTNQPDSYDVTLAVSAFHRFADTVGSKAGAEEMKQRLRVILKWVGYVAAYLFAFALFFYLTFPYEQLKQRIISGYNASQSGPSPEHMEIDSLGWSWRFPGIVAKGVRLISASTGQASSASGEPGAPKVLSVERVSARISPLLLLFGTKQVSFSADAFEGEISGTASTSSDGQELAIELSDVAPGQIPVLGQVIGLPIAGKLNGDMDLLLPEGKASLARGEIDFKFEDIEIGDGKAKIRNTLALPTIQVGTLDLKATATNGQVKIEQLKASGPDIEVEAEGKIRLRDKLPLSTAELEARFKFTDRYKGKSDVTKALFGDPGSNTPGVFDLDPTIKRAKQEDGAYAWTVAGSLERLQFNPSSRHASAAGSQHSPRTGGVLGGRLPILKAKEVAPEPAPAPPPAVVEPTPIPAPAAEPRKDAGH